MNMKRDAGGPRCVTRLVMLTVAVLSACAAPERRFPLRAPLWRDSDLDPVSVPCPADAPEASRGPNGCAPRPYQSSLIWDGTDSVAFRQLSTAFRLERRGEAIDVNSLDEVPDSAWFTNRLGVRPVSIDELRLGACRPEQLLDPAAAPDGSWVIDSGKKGGSVDGFRVVVPGKGQYLLKATDGMERVAAADLIGIAIYHAVGFDGPCDQTVRVRPALLTLRPNLQYKLAFDNVHPFDQQMLAKVLAGTTAPDGVPLMTASAWLPGYIIGPFRYDGLRADDPSDVIPHQDRRELRASRLLAAWINHFDTREGNTLDAWVSSTAGAPAASPGYVRHYHIDTSESLSSDAWGQDELARRIGHAYVIDWGRMSGDFVTLGAWRRPWDDLRPVQNHPLFGYFDADHFTPELWRNQFPNEAFDRMTERDGAWMARILARFTPEMVRALVALGQFTNPDDAAYLTRVLEGRLHKILERYLTRLAPFADLRVDGPRRDQLCGVDLAALRGLRPAARFQFDARLAGGAALPVQRLSAAELCVSLPHQAPDGGDADDAPSRYVRVVLRDGVASGALGAYLYDLGPARGFVLAGLER